MEVQQASPERPSWGLKENLPFFVILLLIFILPLLVIPGSTVPLEVGKKAVLAVGVFLAFIVWLSARLFDGRFVFPRSPILASALLVLAAVFLSSLLSPVKSVSFAGLGFETGTFLSLVVFFLLLFLASIFFEQPKRLFWLYLGVLLSFLVVVIVQVLQLTAGLNFLGLGLSTDNLLDRWSDLAIFAGLVVLANLVLLEFGRLNRTVKIISWFFFILGLAVLMVVNFTTAWWVLAASSLLVYLFRLVVGRRLEPAAESVGPEARRLVRISLILFLLSVVLAIWAPEGSRFDRRLDTFAPTPIEVRPSWSGTYEVVRGTFPTDPILGTGPNRFSSAWNLHKPLGSNEGPFWNIDFNTGVGHLPTFLVTTGIFGFLAWLVFLAAILLSGLKAIFANPSSEPGYLALLAVFISVLFLWTLWFIYIPGTVMSAFTFLATGIFIALLVQRGLAKNSVLVTAGTPVIGFAAVLAVIVLLIASASGLYLVVQKWRAFSNFQNAVFAFTSEGDLEKSESLLDEALSLDKRDLYFRQRSEVLIEKLRRELNDPAANQDVLQARFLSTYGKIVESVRSATEADPTNHLNWLAFANAYEILIPLGNTEAYGLSSGAYERAVSAAPKNPLLYHRRAQLELLAGNSGTARDYLGKAISVKNNFTPSLFLLAQLDVEEGKLKEAIAKSEKAVEASPNDLGLLFQLGFLYYRDDNFEGTARALERAIALNPNYANAKYFLGLAYYELEEREKAIKQFEDLQVTNPGHEGVRTILENLKAGRAPFAGIAPPANQPERGSSPPIDESR